jgi:hypothetical protein
MTAAILGAAARARGGRWVVIRAIRSLVDLGRRTFSRGAGHRVWLGCVEYGHRFYVFAEELVLVLPSRTGEPGALTNRIPSHPGTAPAPSPGPGLDESGEQGGAS